MPSFILKTTPDRDCYVIWSTVVDAPTFIGDRKDTEQHLRRFGENGDGKRLDRADKTGTSCKEPGYMFGDWNDESLIVANVFNDFRSLPRKNLEAFTRAVAEDRLDDALKLTEPCDDD